MATPWATARKVPAPTWQTWHDSRATPTIAVNAPSKEGALIPAARPEDLRGWKGERIRDTKSQSLRRVPCRCPRQLHRGASAAASCLRVCRSPWRRVMSTKFPPPIAHGHARRGAPCRRRRRADMSYTMVIAHPPRRAAANGAALQARRARVHALALALAARTSTSKCSRL